ncbi:hypothetical protein N7G274_006569 [Stereocaulon virgatum]|uniref:Uncharacterized protein n=1 Tax=Stereocaulon virgatum TaxID=373712 RepID=A0ABR4A687_9LECA
MHYHGGKCLGKAALSPSPKRQVALVKARDLYCNLDRCWMCRLPLDCYLSLVEMISNNSNEVTPEELADLLVPKDVRISPSGNHVVYSCAPIARTGEHALSSLWIAEIGKEHSARQFTSGSFNDISPQWCPQPADKDLIAFMSDRAKAGESSAIYLISLHGGEACPVTKMDNKKSIAGFKWESRWSTDRIHEPGREKR